MALDRQSIEKRDFPIGRRGYDPDAVDTHLAQVADEVDELKVSSRRHTETLASTAGDQVRAIIEAAEAGAAEIKRQAEEDARAVRGEAAADAHSTRDGATAQAHDYVGRVSEATAAMLQKINAMEGELATLVESLKSGANRLNADLQLLEGSFETVRANASPRGAMPADEDTAPAPAGASAGLGSVQGGGAAAVAASSAGSAGLGSNAAGGAATGAGSAAEAAAPAAGTSDDAKLIALNMALNGTPRAETAEYLGEHFPDVDQDALLDEVYESAGD